jgi:hypothetical protein
MKWNELPKEYQDLEKTFCENNRHTNDDNILGRFNWFSAPQGQHFWAKCHRAKSIDELPPIPGEKKSVEKEKAFEVISFRSKVLKKIAKLYPNGFYQKNAFDNSGWTYEALINDNDTEIYQVKRLFDNITFSINDETNYGLIKEFILSKDRYSISVYVDNIFVPLFSLNHKEYKMTINECEIEDKVFAPTEKSRTIGDIDEILLNWKDFKSESEIEFMTTLDMIKYRLDTEGIKESEGKLNVEYDWDFLKGQMNRMSKNKDKYPKFNWKKPMDVEQLKDAMFRHTLEVMNNNFEDDGDAMGHLYAISLNAMMIFTQLNNGSKPDEK